MMPSTKLTPREIEVLTLSATGKTSSKIAKQLAISQETVRAHIKHACRKLKAVNKVHAVALALNSGLIFPKRGIE